MNRLNSNSLLVRITLLITSTLTVMSGATIAPSLPAMQTYFSEMSNADYLVRLTLTIPALFVVIGAPLAGLIVDRFGRKPLLIISVLIYGLAGSSGFILDSLDQILIGRALLGLTVAGIMTSTTTLIADYYLGQARAKYMGLQAAFMNLGGVVFLSSGGFLADINWRIPFLIYLLALLILPLVVLVLYEPNRHLTRRPDIYDTELPQTDPVPIKLLILIYGSALISQIVFYLIIVQMPFYLQSLGNASASQSGLAIAFTTLFSGLTAIAYGKVKAQLNFTAILTLSFALFGIGYIAIGAISSYSQAFIGLAIAGIGLGLIMPNFTVWLSALVPDAMRGRALGGLTTFFFLGQFLSPIISQPLSQRVGLNTTYSLTGCLMFLLAVLLLGMKQQLMTLNTSPSK
ncbi:MFS transporter [Nodularia sp. NIES-3585]|uniref:MFS transporter n=1 Tax=Nodularia sp. NIES-3585 TaxID=1973477 RepID=UPI000B5C8D43|nr:MFS transporter [Nodularia sp. NIES-3585]GAX38313.1 major facilitator superfamily MFS_1 [Nodularia sp. NIES-3585]